MTHNPSRKQFFGKLLGAVATVSVLPKLFAGSASAPMANAAGTPAEGTRTFAIRVDARAIARRDTV